MSTRSGAASDPVALRVPSGGRPRSAGGPRMLTSFVRRQHHRLHPRASRSTSIPIREPSDPRAFRSASIPIREPSEQRRQQVVGRPCAGSGAQVRAGSADTKGEGLSDVPSQDRTNVTELSPSRPVVAGRRRCRPVDSEVLGPPLLRRDRSGTSGRAGASRPTCWALDNCRATLR